MSYDSERILEMVVKNWIKTILYYRTYDRRLVS